MNYLAICQRAALECGVTNSSDVPSSVSGQTGNLLRIVNWAADAYTELQTSQKNWKWLRRKFTFNTVADTSEYAYGSITDVAASGFITRLERWLLNDPRNPPKCYLASGSKAAEYFLGWLEWDDFQALYEHGTWGSQPPVHISVAPDKQIHLGPPPSAAFTVSGNYQRSPQVLSGGADVPEMPPEFHMVIVYDTMYKYGNFESALEIINRQKTEGAALRSQLRADQLPMLRRGAALA